MLAEIALNEGEREKLQGANYRRNLYNKVPFFHALPFAYKFLNFLSNPGQCLSCGCAMCITWYTGNKVGTVARALAFHQCVLVSIPYAVFGISCFCFLLTFFVCEILPRKLVFFLAVTMFIQRTLGIIMRR